MCKPINAAKRLSRAYCRREKRHPCLLPFGFLGRARLVPQPAGEAKRFRCSASCPIRLCPSSCTATAEVQSPLRGFPGPACLPVPASAPWKTCRASTAVRQAGRATRELGGVAVLAILTRGAPARGRALRQWRGEAFRARARLAAERHRKRVPSRRHCSERPIELPDYDLFRTKIRHWLHQAVRRRRKPSRRFIPISARLLPPASSSTA